MGKISKSDLVLPRAEEDAQRAAQAAKPVVKSQHFAVGTFVQTNNQRGEVQVEITGPDGETLLQVLWDNGRMGLIKPFALNR